MDRLLGGSAPPDIALPTLVANLLLCLVLSTALAWYYTRFGRALSNRARFAQALPPLAVTTALVITVIKSSLFLSLGLVGALSIVRFRTAIKDPEELLYLFMSIAIGLGIGAEEQMATILAMLVIVGYLSLREILMPRRLRSNLYVDILSADGTASFAEINALMLRHAARVNLRRLDRRDESLEATYLIQTPSDDALVALMDDLRASLPGCEFSFVEQDNTLAG